MQYIGDCIAFGDGRPWQPVNYQKRDACHQVFARICTLAKALEAEWPDAVPVEHKTFWVTIRNCWHLHKQGFYSNLIQREDMQKLQECEKGFDLALKYTRAYKAHNLKADETTEEA